MTIEADVSQTWHDAIIELFELDLSAITGSAEDKYYFTANVMPDNTKIRWKGIAYEPLPIAAAGFERTTKGQIPTPELTVANVLGTLASVVNTLDDLVGAKVIRRRTLLKYLDGGSAPDPSQEFPDDIFYVERKIAESSITITWQLASKIDLEGLQLPRRIITQNYCLWKYRGAECGYNGPAIANEFDQPISIGGSVSAAGSAYIAAFNAFNAARTNLANAEARKNRLFGEKESACSGEGAESLETAFVFEGGGIRDYTFAIQDGDGNTIISMWNGSVVSTTNDSPEYRPGYKQNTGRGPGGDNNGTGTAYTVIKYYSGGDTEYSIELPFSNSTFAIKDQDGQPIVFVDGQRAVNAGSTTYSLGRYASAGFAPMRSLSTLDYDNTQCTNKTNAYNNAVSQYNTALSQFNAAQAALNAAYAALPSGDEVNKRDRCGKRLQSCRLRFPGGNLPFGGFPGANLTR